MRIRGLFESDKELQITIRQNEGLGNSGQINLYKVQFKDVNMNKLLKVKISKLNGLLP